MRLSKRWWARLVAGCRLKGYGILRVVPFASGVGYIKGLSQEHLLGMYPWKMCILMFSYRAMHYSAKRGLVIACRLSDSLSVRLSDVGGS